MLRMPSRQASWQLAYQTPLPRVVVVVGLGGFVDEVDGALGSPVVTVVLVGAATVVVAVVPGGAPPPGAAAGATRGPRRVAPTPPHEAPPPHAANAPHPPLGREDPVAPAVRGGRQAHEPVAAPQGRRGAEELGVAEGEDAAALGQHPVAGARRRGHEIDPPGHGTEGLAELGGVPEA